MTLDEIKAAVEAGRIVHWTNPGYTVIRDSLGQYLIVHKHSTIGLTWQDGVTLNGDPDDFFIARPSDFHIQSLSARVTDAEQQLAERREAWLASLPDFPTGGRCTTCGLDFSEYRAIQLVEPGYLRHTNGQVKAADEHGREVPIADGATYVLWSTNSWDDMSETGDGASWVECNGFDRGCGQAYKRPVDNEEWSS